MWRTPQRAAPAFVPAFLRPIQRHECRCCTLKRAPHRYHESVMSDRFPAPVYAETVLAHNFDDAKKHFLDALIRIHYAHTRMLAKQGILTRDEERVLLAALDGLDRPRIEAARFDGSQEDLFFYIETMLEETAGP